MAGKITVRGVGSVSRKPDYAELNLIVRGRNAEYDTALHEASAKVNAISESIAAAEFEKEDLKTSNFTVNTEYDSVQRENGRWEQVFSAYVCTYSMKLGFDFETEKLAAAISAVSASQPELSIRFTVKEPEQIEEELLASAAANARGKAEILCRASGVKLGDLVSIDYNWGEVNVYSTTCLDAEPPMLTKSCIADIVPEDIRTSDSAAFVWELL